MKKAKLVEQIKGLETKGHSLQRKQFKNQYLAQETSQIMSQLLSARKMRPESFGAIKKALISIGKSV